jgi:hypothetical protein
LFGWLFGWLVGWLVVWWMGWLVRLRAVCRFTVEISTGNVQQFHLISQLDTCWYEFLTSLYNASAKQTS